MVQLLSNNQIYKAQHVLKNMGLEPVKEIRNRFVDTTCVELRRVIGKYLLENDFLEERLRNSWHLLSSVENDADTLATLKRNHDSINVSLIDNMDEEWRSATGTRLFFKFYNFDLESFVVPGATWRYLLENDRALLKLWIEAYFGNESFSNRRVANLDPHVVEKLCELFSSFPITKNMLNSLWDADIAPDVRRMVLGEFAGHGVLDERDDDVVEVLRGILSTGNADELETVLMKHGAVNLNTFRKLVVRHCTDNELCGVLNLYVKDTSVFDDVDVANKTYLNVIEEFRRSFSNLSDVSALRENVVQTARFLRDGTLIEHSSDFPVILLAVLLLSEINVLELLTTDVAFEIDGLEVNKNALLRSNALPMFGSLLNATLFNPQLDQYDLLRKYCGVPRDLYGFRYASSPMPHFGSGELIKTCNVYDKPLDYKHYLLECRPSHAALVFKLDSSGNEANVDTVVKQVHKIALENNCSEAIRRSCVWFLEFLGVGSYKLKVHLQVASVIRNASPDYPLLKIVTMDEHAEEINGKLESVVIGDSVNGVDVFDTLRKYDLVVEFSSLHNLKRPKLFLRHCADNNLWVLFLVFVQMYKYPVDVTRQMALLFDDVTLREHVSHAVSHDVQVEDVNVFFTGNRDYRKHFLFKLGVQLSDSSGSSLDSMSLSSYGSAFSYNDFGDGAYDTVDDECSDSCANMLQALMKCHDCGNPSRAFLRAATHHKIALFAVLADCYEVRHVNVFIVNQI